MGDGKTAPQLTYFNGVREVILPSIIYYTKKGGGQSCYKVNEAMLLRTLPNRKGIHISRIGQYGPPDKRQVCTESITN